MPSRSKVNTVPVGNVTPAVGFAVVVVTGVPIPMTIEPAGPFVMDEIPTLAHGPVIANPPLPGGVQVVAPVPGTVAAPPPEAGGINVPFATLIIALEGNAVVFVIGTGKLTVNTITPGVTV